MIKPWFPEWIGPFDSGNERVLYEIRGGPVNPENVRSPGRLQSGAERYTVRVAV
jgi:hypothetical protein